MPHDAQCVAFSDSNQAHIWYGLCDFAAGCGFELIPLQGARVWASAVPRWLV